MIRGIQTTIVTTGPKHRSTLEPQLRIPSRIHNLPPSSVAVKTRPLDSTRPVVSLCSRLYAAAHLGGGALGLDVARLLALVADLLAGGGALGAVAREVAVLAAVVALGAVDTVTCWVRLSATGLESMHSAKQKRDLRDMWPMPPQL